MILASFKCWLSQRIEGEVPELQTGFEPIEPQANLKGRVRKRRNAGAKLEAIAAEFDISVYTASEWCQDIKVEKQTVRGTAAKRRAEKNAEDAQLKINALQLQNKELSLTQIARTLKISRRKLKRLLES